jgi:hypothetical protein
VNNRKVPKNFASEIRSPLSRGVAAGREVSSILNLMVRSCEAVFVYSQPETGMTLSSRTELLSLEKAVEAYRVVRC